MASLSFKDFLVVEYRPGEDELTNYRAQKRKRTNEEVEVDEELSIQGRRKLARSAKRRKTRLALAKKRAMKRLANTKVIKKRSRRAARATFADQLAGSGNKKSEVSIAKKKAIEKRLSQGGWQQRIAILQRRMMPKKRRAEIARKR
jgi:hypothetical protein